ncbi:nucleotidyltransferase, partial [Brevibacillus agri]|uniref:cyclic GMP-AMP synthase DncV-like nucleotidyltransferase n=1 Tax=Brevibacillus agri TaxID=51101 RepID=UPI002EC6A695|nr:nucleotidyltransferase [Brevibacillus agri]
MYNLSSKFNTFYNDHVVLSRDEQNNLRDKKDLNISRLKSGLQEYNTENETSYSVVEIIEQGSMAMSTITQNDQSEYDIDVAIVFDKDSIPERTTSVKNIVVDALKRKCKQFKTEPEALTNAVRVEYADGYHVDFAIYRRYKNEEDEYEYEHCGSQWRLRNLQCSHRL